MNLAEPLASVGTDRHSVRVTRRMWSAMLVGLMCLSSLALAGPQAASAAPRTVRPADRTARATLTSEEFEHRLLVRSNARRAARGCHPLRLNAALSLAAHRHSTLMSDQSDLSHRLAGEADLAARAVNAGYTRWRILAENLAWGQSSPGQVFRDWVNSPGHRANLDNCRLRDVGFAVVFQGGRPWVTADYGRHF